MNHIISTLDTSEAPRYQSLALPMHRSLLSSLDDRHTAIGVQVFGWPVGLGLLRIDSSEGRTTGQVLSIAVADLHRGHGIGTALLGELEREARDRGCGELRLWYSVSRDHTSPLERLLASHDWKPPETSRILFKLNWIEHVPGPGGETLTVDRYSSPESSWIRGPHTLPPGMELFDWGDLSDAEIEVLEEQCSSDPRYRDALWDRRLPIDPLASVGLRYQGEITGWVHQRRISPDNQVCDNLWIRRDMMRLRHIGVGQTLLGVGMNRGYQTGITRGSFCVDPGNRHMLRFAERHLGHLKEGVRELRVASKELAPAE